MPGRKVWRPAQEIETERRSLPMNPEVQKLKHSFWMSIFWIVLLLVAVTGSTYAWFTFAAQDFHERDADGGLNQRG